jgi:hypothetical protein
MFEFGSECKTHEVAQVFITALDWYHTAAGIVTFHLFGLCVCHYHVPLARKGVALLMGQSYWKLRIFWDVLPCS